MFSRRKTEPKKTLPVSPIDYPDGVCVKSETGYWYLKGKLRFSVPTQRTLDSWRFPVVIETTEAALANYTKGGKIGFRSGSFLFDMTNGGYYIISGRIKRKIVNPDIFELFGLDRAQALWVSQEELDLHKNGEVFN